MDPKEDCAKAIIFQFENTLCRMADALEASWLSSLPDH
jgi:hypothetical protein